MGIAAHERQVVVGRLLRTRARCEKQNGGWDEKRSCSRHAVAASGWRVAADVLPAVAGDGDQSALARQALAACAWPLAAEPRIDVGAASARRVGDRRAAARVDVGDELPVVGVPETLARYGCARHSVLEAVERLRIGRPEMQ